MTPVKFQKIKLRDGCCIRGLHYGTSELMEVAVDSFTYFKPRERYRTGPKTRVAVGISIHCTASHNKNISI